MLGRLSEFLRHSVDKECLDNASVLHQAWEQIKLEGRNLFSTGEEQRAAQIFLKVNELKNDKNELLGTMQVIAAVGALRRRLPAAGGST